MPKIIKDLKPQIKQAALELYETIGYDQVSMRGIATKLGIAVGTLYNYYPNKDTLFLSSLEESWLLTIENIEQHISKSEDPRDRLQLLVSTLYEDMIERKGLGKELFSKNSDHLDSMSHIFTKLQDLMIELIYDYNPDGFEDRKALTLVMDIGHLIASFKDEKEKNIEYLMSIM